jgi:NAD(P)-dependent dehydrogenase (short-subunit alcohol dehydrogenase family)
MRTYIVSGGGGGIGGAAVRQLLRAGNNVLAVDISSRRLGALEEEAGEIGGQLKTMKADVTSEEGAKEIIDRAIGEFEELHGVANVAGGMPAITGDMQDRPLQEITLDFFRATMALNAESTFLMCKAAEPYFASRHYGKFVNVASLAAFANRPELGNVAYNPAKASVVALTRTLSILLGPVGIRSNCVAPGLVISDRVAATYGQDFVDRHLAWVPGGELVTKDQVAAAIVFFLKPESDGITGEVIRASAGVQ